MSEAFAEVLREPEIDKRWREMTLNAVGGTPSEIRALLNAETERWRKVIDAGSPPAAMSGEESTVMDSGPINEFLILLKKHTAGLFTEFALMLRGHPLLYHLFKRAREHLWSNERWFSSLLAASLTNMICLYACL